MLQLEEFELYFLRRVILLRLDTLKRNLDKNRRYFRDTDDDVLYQCKIGNLEAEMSCMESVREKVNKQIALLSIRD